MLLGIISLLASLAAKAGREMIVWAKQEALRLARMARALVVWVAAHNAARAALSIAVFAAFEVLAAYLLDECIQTVESNFLVRLMPDNDGAGFFWLLWDSGLNGRALFSAFVAYLVNYTLMWRVFASWMRSVAIALSTYRAAMRTAEAVRQSSV